MQIVYRTSRFPPDGGLLGCNPVALAMNGSSGDKQLVHALRRRVVPLRGALDFCDGLRDFAGDAEVVVLGAPSHGMREPFERRAMITRWLVEECGFNALALEADWLATRRLDRFVRGRGGEDDPHAALEAFGGFPSWCWRHAGMRRFIEWLRGFNRTNPRGAVIGLCGLDLYGLHRSMNDIVFHLGQRDRLLAAAVRAGYGHVDRFGRDPQNYGLVSCQEMDDATRCRLVHLLAVEREREAARLTEADAQADEFTTRWNARLGSGAGWHYRAMFRSYTSSWNHREKMMMEVLSDLAAHLRQSQGKARIVVWTHNAHAGDARATELSWRGETSLGALVRDQFEGNCRLVGFTTHSGRVTAADGWLRRPRSRAVRAAPLGSIENLFHQVGLPAFWCDFTKPDETTGILSRPRLQRGIGLVYHPVHGTRGNWFNACVTGQFDAVIHGEHTRATEPLHAVTRQRGRVGPEPRSTGRNVTKIPA